MLSKLATAAFLAAPVAQAWPTTFEARKSQIVNGEDAELGEFPFLVALTLEGDLLCGGSLVDATTVVTAAHCSDFSPSEVQVVAGTIDIGSGGQTLDVSDIIVHPEFTSPFVGYDVAVWKLASAVETGPNVAFVSLPTLGSDLTGGDIVTVAGWGRTSGGGPIAEIQQKVDIPVISRTECSSDLGSTISDTMVCAGTTTEGACNGDSGGPLIDASGTLVGTVSWGSSSCLNSPSVFGHVGSFVDFIEANM